jgi:uncharacterized protein
MDVVYLHGFASSARSSKAAYFAGKLRELGVVLHTPDFNEPDFSTLTITRMIDQVERAMGGMEDVALIGSSLGGFVAVQVAQRNPARVSRLALLAPALEFQGNRVRELGDRGLDEWRRTNRLDVFHYGYGRVMPIQYGLYEDLARYDCFNARLPMPVQIFQGTRDTSVRPETVEKWAASRKNVELHMLDDDHQLTASLDDIWKEMRRFLTLDA